MWPFAMLYCSSRPVERGMPSWDWVGACPLSHSALMLTGIPRLRLIYNAGGRGVQVDCSGRTAYIACATVDRL